ncbi:hypothetical protein MED15_03871 [Micromonospora noduli]|uniref:Uncharacterized protein n=1 Tax=Micromonospora noduli TaxID=709876 RepID=A0A328N2M3_9ACTN|nr:hypothetical protein LAH08_03183 [Micromonospora noduli]RAO13555.1 hypothetical protein LUPAC07_03847 [Micromonospora noduli]RAO16352.1 hypothetical protein MED15_03871 [Micromonospora noduli]
MPRRAQSKGHIERGRPVAAMDAEADGGCLRNADWRGDRGRHASGAMSGTDRRQLVRQLIVGQFQLPLAMIVTPKLLPLPFGVAVTVPLLPLTAAFQLF